MVGKSDCVLVRGGRDKPFYKCKSAKAVTDPSENNIVQEPTVDKADADVKIISDNMKLNKEKHIKHKEKHGGKHGKKEKTFSEGKGVGDTQQWDKLDTHEDETKSRESLFAAGNPNEPYVDKNGNKDLQKENNDNREESANTKVKEKEKFEELKSENEENEAKEEKIFSDIDGKGKGKEGSDQKTQQKAETSTDKSIISEINTPSMTAVAPGHM